LRETLRVVCIGGGHGLSQIAKYLDPYEDTDLSFLVTPFDSGGSTGRLREKGVIGAGDYTRVCNALSRSSERLVRVRDLRDENHDSVRNLQFADLWEKYGPKHAMELTQERYDVGKNRRVFLSTLDDCHLRAQPRTGRPLYCEHVIDTRGASDNGIIHLSLDREARIYPPIKTCILAADLIVIGPGSLFTSVLPHFLIQEFPTVINRSKGKRIYICNSVTEPGSTEGFGVIEHIDWLTKRVGEKGVKIDYVLVDNTKIYRDKIREGYNTEHKDLIPPDLRTNGSDYKVIVGSFTYLDGSSIVHGPETAREILRIGGYNLSD
jgi:uncharacterized cofD-like protein